MKARQGDLETRIRKIYARVDENKRKVLDQEEWKKLTWLFEGREAVQPHQPVRRGCVSF